MIRDSADEAVFLHKYELLQAGTCAMTKQHGFRVSCSIGGTTCNALPGAEYNVLFHSADDALYEAKAFGKGSYVMHAVAQASPSRQHPVMLIADDEPVTRTLLSNLFREHYSIVEAEDGNKALNLISQYQAQLEIILLDIIMPGKSGLEILEYLKSRESLAHIPVVVITADESSEKAALQAGAADVIPKPVNIDITRLRVANARRQ